MHKTLTKTIESGQLTKENDQQQNLICKYTTNKEKEIERALNVIAENPAHMNSSSPTKSMDTQNGIQNSLDNSASIIPNPNKDLDSCGTYKVRIKLRRTSTTTTNTHTTQNTNMSNSQLSNSPSRYFLKDLNSLPITNSIEQIKICSNDLGIKPRTPQKALASSFSTSNEAKSLSKYNTPVKSIDVDSNCLNSDLKSETINYGILSSITNSSSNLINGASSFNSSGNTNSFECPVCDKKFVSYYGLFQHYDTHPDLAVTCTLCLISFDNHESLVMHNLEKHKTVENNEQALNPRGKSNLRSEKEHKKTVLEKEKYIKTIEDDKKLNDEKKNEKGEETKIIKIKQVEKKSEAKSNEGKKLDLNLQYQEGKNKKKINF
jgi:hypothetical protein